MAKPEETAIVILAAGASTRMGRPKQLLEISGVTLIERVCRLALKTSCHPVVVVLGAEGHSVKKAINGLISQLHIVQNDQWQQGMGTSVHAGVLALSSFNPPPKAVLVLLVDQPYVDLSLLTRLLQKITANPTKIIATAYEDILGVPAIFPETFFEALSQIEGDKGARKILSTYHNQVLAVSFPKAAQDLDTPEDWERLLGS